MYFEVEQEGGGRLQGERFMHLSVSCLEGSGRLRVRVQVEEDAGRNTEDSSTEYLTYLTYTLRLAIHGRFGGLGVARCPTSNLLRCLILPPASASAAYWVTGRLHPATMPRPNLVPCSLVSLAVRV